MLVLRTFSKAYGLAALRVGYAMAQPEVISELRKLHVPFEVNGVAQAAALASVAAQTEMRERVDGVIAERERMYGECVARGYPIVASQANFLWFDLPLSAVELAFHGERNGVVMRSFADTGVRLTVGAPDENEAAMAVLASARSAGWCSSGVAFGALARGASLEYLGLVTGHVLLEAALALQLVDLELDVAHQRDGVVVAAAHRQAGRRLEHLVHLTAHRDP